VEARGPGAGQVEARGPGAGQVEARGPGAGQVEAADVARFQTTNEIQRRLLEENRTLQEPESTPPTDHDQGESDLH